jgi:hypothetical protein
MSTWTEPVETGSRKGPGREGWPDNKKRIHRLYRLEGLQVRMRARQKQRRSLHRGVVPPASGRDRTPALVEETSRDKTLSTTESAFH